jgi:hypothetical protein
MMKVDPARVGITLGLSAASGYEQSRAQGGEPGQKIPTRQVIRLGLIF